MCREQRPTASRVPRSDRVRRRQPDLSSVQQSLTHLDILVDFVLTKQVLVLERNYLSALIRFETPTLHGTLKLQFRTLRIICLLLIRRQGLNDNLADRVALI